MYILPSIRCCSVVVCLSRYIGLYVTYTIYIDEHSSPIHSNDAAAPEESYITQIEYGFDSHEVEIVDTAGQEEFMLLRDTALAQGDAFLALFAINSISSWYSLQELRDKIVREHGDDESSIPMVIVANKNVSIYCHRYNMRFRVLYL